MKSILLTFIIFSISYSTEWQVPQPIQPGNLAINSPSFSGDNLRIYCGIYYSIYHGDIAYYDWNGTQWVYVDRVPGDVNTTSEEFEPFITYDGQHLYFDRYDTNHVLYVADWNGSAFINSRALNANINQGDSRYPSLTQDMQYLYFAKGLKIYVSEWNGLDWGIPTILPPSVNNGGMYRYDVTISPDGNEIYFTGTQPHSNWIAFSRKVGGVWQQWQYCDSNINIPGCTLGSEALTYAPYETQELYFARNFSPGTLTWHALRSPVAVEPASLGQIKANYK